jgi:(p)ppGpp synthase/HD superfamily hydrolase
VIAEGLPQTHVAVAFCHWHACRQERADGTPFILHPPEVATRLCLAGAPDHLIAAEYPTSSNVSASGLRQRFGPRITEPVLAVTGDEQIDAYANRNAALRRQSCAGEEALTLFAADKPSRLGELRRETAANPGAAPRRVRSASRVLAA